MYFDHIKRILQLTSLVLLVLPFSISCEKEELPYPPAVIVGKTAMLGVDYRYQEYYNILTNEFVQNNEHMGWDLSFEANEEGIYVFLNSSNYALARSAGVVDFESVSDTTGITPWKYDFPTQKAENSSIRTWFNADNSSKNEVYIVDRGLDKQGIPIGYFKLQIISVNAISYKIKVASLDNTNMREVDIFKNSDKRWIQFSFDEVQAKEMEPNIENWHILFTQYTGITISATNDTVPYLVRGALINPTNLEGILVTTVSFDAIDKDYATQLELTKNANCIGYDWKSFSLSDGTYTIVPDMSYVLKHKSGIYYKLRFVGFYSDSGEKGYPNFEVIAL